MKTCPNCEHDNPYDATHCGNCGLKLGTTTLLTSRQVTRKTGLLTPLTQEDMYEDLRDIIQNVLKETSTPEQAEFLRFEIKEADHPLIVPIKRELLIGRRDPSSPVQPDVNLTPYAGYRMGVSRRHALITRTADGELTLTDLGSSNGTFINEQKLEVRRPYPLKPGEQVALGQMVMTIHVHQPEKP